MIIANVEISTSTGRNEANTHHTETNKMGNCYLHTLQNVVSESQILYSKKHISDMNTTNIIYMVHKKSVNNKSKTTILKWKNSRK